MEPSITKKWCSSCRKTKPFDDFYKDKSGKFGRTANCMDCVKARQQKKWSEKRANIIDILGVKKNDVLQCMGPCGNPIPSSDMMEVYPTTEDGRDYRDAYPSYNKFYNFLMEHKDFAIWNYKLVCKNCATALRNFKRNST